MKFALIFTLMLCLIFAFSEDLFARAGGGQSFSSSRSESSSSSSSSSSNSYTPSSSSSSSSSSSEEGGPADVWLFFFILIIVVALALRGKGGLRSNPFLRTPLREAFPCGPQHHLPKGAVSAAIDEYRKVDPNFSRPMFLDFAQLLYTRYHVARGSQELPALSFYIAEDIIEKATKASEKTKKIENLIIGSARIVDLKINGSDSFDHITVAFEANYDETVEYAVPVRGSNDTSNSETKEATGGLEIYEIWHFVRKTGTVSPDNKPIKSITCPSCGASAETDNKGVCKSCGNTVSDGSFYWLLNKIEIDSSGIRPPIQIGYGGVEEGTELRTVLQKNLDKHKQQFESNYPEFSWQEFSFYAKEVFLNIQDAWTNRRWEKARPFETDHLFSMHNFWIEKYTKENLRNVLENISVKEIKVCKVEMDKYYDSITVRIFASMKDSTVSMGGGFAPPKDVPTTSFSEYWTFIRKSGVNPKHLSSKECPNCGAELSVNMAGVCEYCNSKISSGEFSWVLSMIEQDEVYLG